MLFTKSGKQIDNPPRKIPVHILASLDEKKIPRSYKDKECKGFFSLGTRATFKG